MMSICFVSPQVFGFEIFVYRPRLHNHSSVMVGEELLWYPRREHSFEILANDVFESLLYTFIPQELPVKSSSAKLHLPEPRN
jgi:hypothetical protein